MYTLPEAAALVPVPTVRSLYKLLYANPDLFGTYLQKRNRVIRLLPASDVVRLRQLSVKQVRAAGSPALSCSPSVAWHTANTATGSARAS